MGMMTKFYQEPDGGNYHLLLRPYDPETYEQDGQPAGGSETVTEVVWTPEEFNAVCMVIDRHRQESGSLGE